MDRCFHYLHLYLFVACHGHLLGQNVLLVDLRESFSDLGEGGGGGETKKERKKSSENGQLTGLFQSFFVILISPEKTVKLYGKVNQQSVLNLFIIYLKSGQDNHF